ncbi:Cof-type HAD-IIB family hydrolase [Floccifex sp.]|uniref:Cof-type HAD-IIB family hydrolase n=1 Tax=Floccifex sp. TaxID=2815810 RepID=UPI002A758391|nr:Cof-type HAD-IIB family hydrolase [Floccifex sp.]MDD7281884.1 Cof-type HAD-IIB family hydrolase [Erysipelotrichaceae bacterium]MDY2958605.1 Cof-type HAD-IIB family hydrolase [Floccifex sp.]
MTIKCLAFDLDGTLLRSDKTMDPRTVHSIKKAMAQGIHVVIASGRDKNGCKFVYEPLELDKGNHFLALVNGQIIYDFKNLEYDLDDVLTNEDAIKIQRICKEFNVEGIFQCGYDFYSYVSSLNRMKKKVKSLIFNEPEDYGLKAGIENRNFINLPYKENEFTQDINKVIMVHSKSFFEKNLDDLKKALCDYDVLLIGPEWLEIMPKGVNKASALRKITKKLGITMDEVMAFGDAENDIQMINECFGVAMGNAMDEVKDVAKIVADTNDNNGIGKIIDEYVLKSIY